MTDPPSRSFDGRVRYVVEEVHEFLRAGPVGLYEFVDMQRDGSSPPDERQYREVARHALQRLMAEPDVRLIWQIWPRFDPVPGPDTAGDDDAHWQTPGEGPYPAVIRAADL
jgi:hypothetical protein